MILVSNWPGLADERFALLVFIRARRFAHEHERRINVAHAKHDVLARRREVRAFHAGQRAAAQFGKRRGLGSGVKGGSGW